MGAAEALGLAANHRRARFEPQFTNGAIYRLTRAVSKRLPLYCTVFAPHVEMAKALMDAYDSGTRVVMLVRVVYDPYQGPWRGFFWFEDEGTAKKFAFVVTKIVTEMKVVRAEVAHVRAASGFSYGVEQVFVSNPKRPEKHSRLTERLLVENLLLHENSAMAAKNLFIEIAQTYSRAGSAQPQCPPR